MHHIYLYTSYYPYSNPESFLGPELEIANRMGCRLTVIPVNRGSTRRDVPKGIVVDNSICKSGLFFKLKCIAPMFHMMSLVLQEKDWSGFNLRECLKYIYASSLVYCDLKEKAQKKEKLIFYSYWMSYIPIAFALYKYRNRQTPHKFITRGHGTDIYSKDLGVYYPLRTLLLKEIDEFYLISEYGRDYLEHRYPEYKSKFHVSRLGVYDNLSEARKISNKIVVVSCSNVIPLKRVDLIAKSLMAYASIKSDVKIEWIHFGDGEDLSKIKLEIRKSPPNLKCKFKGLVRNTEILNYYKENQIDCYLMMSASEGIPVSIMEAISSGIPVLATDVGGVSEIVTVETGLLLNKYFEQDDFNKKFEYILENHNNLSKSSHAFFANNYSAESNYLKFYNKIMG